MNHEPLTLDNIAKQVVGIDHKVPLLNGEKKRYIYLDNSASTPTLKPVLESLNSFMEWYSNIHRGTGFKSLISTHYFEQAREIILVAGLDKIVRDMDDAIFQAKCMAIFGSETLPLSILS